MRSPAAIIGIREPGALELVQTLLRQGISVRIRVSGDSMQPLLKGGEVVEVAPLAGKIPILGEILFLHDQQGNPLVHRLIWRRRRDSTLLLLTKGDACSTFDGFITAEQVFGCVQKIVDTGSGTAIDLRTPLKRFHAALIVSRILMSHALRRRSHK